MGFSDDIITGLGDLTASAQRAGSAMGALKESFNNFEKFAGPQTQKVQGGLVGLVQTVGLFGRAMGPAAMVATTVFTGISAALDVAKEKAAAMAAELEKARGTVDRLEGERGAGVAPGLLDVAGIFQQFSSRDQLREALVARRKAGGTINAATARQTAGGIEAATTIFGLDPAVVGRLMGAAEKAGVSPAAALAGGLRARGSALGERERDFAGGGVRGFAAAAGPDGPAALARLVASEIAAMTPDERSALQARQQLASSEKRKRSAAAAALRQQNAEQTATDLDMSTEERVRAGLDVGFGVETGINDLIRSARSPLQQTVSRSTSELRAAIDVDAAASMKSLIANIQALTTTLQQQADGQRSSNRPAAGP